MPTDSGLHTCARYAFAPNLFHYCGPEKQSDLLGYLTNGVTDRGLLQILDHFETLYPYLKLIAGENKIKDPFDHRVVEAYWLGNNLLSRIKPLSYYDHLAVRLKLKNKLPKRMHPVLDRLAGGLPNHTFHVLNIFLRTGRQMLPQTIETLDNCRISWGRVVNLISNNNPPVGGQMTNYFLVKIQSLEYKADKLILSKPLIKKYMGLNTSDTAYKVNIGDWVSIHWGYICDKLTVRQVGLLSASTAIAIEYANKHQTVFV